MFPKHVSQAKGVPVAFLDEFAIVIGSRIRVKNTEVGAVVDAEARVDGSYQVVRLFGGIPPVPGASAQRLIKRPDRPSHASAQENRDRHSASPHIFLVDPTALIMEPVEGTPAGVVGRSPSKSIESRILMKCLCYLFEGIGSVPAVVVGKGHDVAGKMLQGNVSRAGEPAL